MKDKSILKVYNDYFPANLGACSQEEAEDVVEKYKKTGRIDEGYIIKEIDEGYKVWRDEGLDCSIEELKARMEVDQAKNIRTIKKCVMYFTVLSLISIIISFIAVVLSIAK